MQYQLSSYNEIESSNCSDSKLNISSQYQHTTNYQNNTCKLPSYFFDVSDSSSYEDECESGQTGSCDLATTPIAQNTYHTKLDHYRGSKILGIGQNKLHIDGDHETIEIPLSSERNVNDENGENEHPLIIGCNETHEENNVNVMTSFVGISPIPSTPIKNNLSPIEQVKSDMRAFQGGDNIFTLSMSNVFSKLTIALNDRTSAYLFRDFAGTFTEFLDRFGPGAYDNHRAPCNISWVIKLILPWLHMCHPEYQSQYSIYSEVCGWALNLVSLMGQEHSKEILDEGLWDTCCDQMTHSDSLVNTIAYRIAKEIIVTVNLDKHLIYKILLLRNVTLGFDDVEMFYFRKFRISMIKCVLDRIDKTLKRDLSNSYIQEIISELEYSVSVETNTQVKQDTEDCLKYAKELVNIPSVFEPRSLKAFNVETILDAVPTSQNKSHLTHQLKDLFSVSPTLARYHSRLNQENDCLAPCVNAHLCETKESPQISKRARAWGALSRAIGRVLRKSPHDADNNDGKYGHLVNARSEKSVRSNISNAFRPIKNTFRKTRGVSKEYNGNMVELLFQTTRSTELTI